jgi:tRNA pseudouridine32 synthase/23S rRNA pseudouridine746 synthase
MKMACRPAFVVNKQHSKGLYMYRIQLQHKRFHGDQQASGHWHMHDDAGEPGLVNRVRMDTGLDLYPVHRLDKMTSGLVLLARTAEANRALSMAFAAREVSKQYLANSPIVTEEEAGLGEG